MQGPQRNRKKVQVTTFFRDKLVLPNIFMQEKMLLIISLTKYNFSGILEVIPQMWFSTLAAIRITWRDFKLHAQAAP